MDPEIDFISLLGNAGITRGTVDVFYLWTLGNLPYQGMFPSATSNYQNLHKDLHVSTGCRVKGAVFGIK